MREPTEEPTILGAERPFPVHRLAHGVTLRPTTDWPRVSQVAKTGSVDAVIARKMLRTLEPYHGAVYFVAEGPDEYRKLGITDRMMGYFGSRSAPMGAVGAEVVIATFFNFHPKLVSDRIPAVWDIASPSHLLDARHRAIDTALRRILGDAIASDEIRAAAAIARRAAEACTPEGRALYAGHASLPWPDEPHMVLWHAQSLLREYRGDGHIAAMCVEGLDGCEALVTHAAQGDVPAAALQGSRQWPDDEWNAAVDRLRSRGWIAPDDITFTELGRERREWIEQRTDELAMRPWEAIGEDECTTLRGLVRPWSKQIVESGELGFARQAVSD
jgi:hypothetical protein